MKRVYLWVSVILLYLLLFGILFRAGIEASAANCYGADEDKEAEITESVSTPAEEKPAEKNAAIVYNTEGIPLDSALTDYLITACERYGVPVPFTLAIAEQESNFDIGAVSQTDDYGLMQINKVNFPALRDMGIDPLTREGNIDGGLYLLSCALTQCNGDINDAAMVYNCGLGGARRLWKRGVASTAYSRNVSELAGKWQTCISDFQN